MAVDDGGGASRSTDPAAGTSSATDVSLREYLNEKIQADRKLNNERFAFAAVIGATIWFFVERHLSDLNHENARVARVSENSVSSDTYKANEQQRKSEQVKLDEWRNAVDADRGRTVTRDEFQKDNRETVRLDTQDVREANADRRGGSNTVLQVGATAAAILVALLLMFTTYRAIKPATSPPGGVTTVFVQPVTTTSAPNPAGP